MSQRDTPPTDADPLVDHVYERIEQTAGWPVRSAALFYALYYLADVKGVGAARFDYQQHRDLLVDGLYDYGIWALGGELGHSENKYYIGGRPAYLARPHELNEHLDDLMAASPPASVSRRWLRRVFDYGGKLPLHDPRANRDEAIRQTRIIEEEWDGFSEDRRFLETCEWLFDNPVYTDEGLRCGWAASFGGESWSRIASRLLEHADTPEAMWIDTIFGIEHNTGQLLSKAYIADAQREKHRTARGPSSPHRVLDRVLNAARREDDTTMLSLAASYNADVDVDLNHYFRLSSSDAL